ncbi:MAG: hypothetical protein ACR2RE_07215 [Geminicoccaceae bacterium]
MATAFRRKITEFRSNGFSWAPMVVAVHRSAELAAITAFRDTGHGYLSTETMKMLALPSGHRHSRHADPPAALQISMPKIEIIVELQPDERKSR